jgi:hypothetical protein
LGRNNFNSLQTGKCAALEQEAAVLCQQAVLRLLRLIQSGMQASQLLSAFDDRNAAGDNANK